MTNCRVSVVIPCYNGEAFIGEAIVSVLSQSYGDFEVIVVDDGSSDGSTEKVRSFEDSRVRLIEHEENKGIAAARNTGIKEAHGEFVAFLDQDDLWYPKKLEKQLAVFDQDTTGEIGLVFTRREILEKGKRIHWRSDMRFPKPIEKASRREVLAAFMKKNFVPMMSVLVRRRCVEDVGLLTESIRSGADDFEFCARVAMKYRFAHVNEVLVTRREHGENYSDPSRFLADDLAVLEQIAEVEPSLKRLIRKRHSDLIYKCARWWHLRGDRSKARKAYIDSIKLTPTKFSATAGLALLIFGPVGDGLYRLWRVVRYSGN